MNTSTLLYETFFSTHPEEAARTLESFPIGDILRVISQTPGRNIAQLLSNMNPSLATEVLLGLHDEVLLRAIPEFSPTQLATLVSRFSQEQREDFLGKVPAAVATELTAFLDYPVDTAGGLMDPRVLALPEDLLVEQAIAQIRAKGSKEIHEVYVIDREQKLVGRVPLRDLLVTPTDERLQSVMERDLLTIHPLEQRDQILDLFSERKLFTLPVTDLDGHLLGVIRNRSIFKAGQEELSADMQTMVGVSADERALSPPMFAVKKRLPWLQINLLTAFLAAFVVGLFESTIAQFTALAVLLPVVAGQSGNTGAQSLAVVMRGLALRDIRPSQWWSVSRKEVVVAFINGVAVALTTCLGVYVWSRSLGLTAVIGVSMILAMTIAGFSGAVIPIILRSLKQDPAQSSSIILTTVTDVFGFFSFLGLATIFSSWLA
ncbi:magnesium transporter [Candidatus Nitronereus thalassa]|uniref:Magnesium transporter n=1 Tax=Candidatus Nitronereus thalassa TaxID=3020898 RepID=A0ABU3K5T3_9BACT|nr:magnesium transporter [Candidatus Nitronereus thalassa]MDT7041760.1 magnesium transporter [Candidatus Nitronereus thalassa]